MVQLAQRQIFDPFCPSGGKWYACSIDSPSQFVGCCAGTEDPCGESSCSARNLRAAGYDPTYHHYLPDVSCPFASSAYKCMASNSFAFFGCCKKDPCFSGSICARSDLEAAFLPSESGAAAAFLPSSTYSSSKSTSTSLLSSSASFSTANFTSLAASSAPTIAASSSNGNKKFIIGGASGGAGLLAIIIGWLVYHCLYARQSRKLKHEDFDRRRSCTLPPIETTFSQVRKHEAMKPESPPVSSSIHNPPRNVYSPDYAPIPPVSPLSASKAYAMPALQSQPLPKSLTSRVYSVSRKDVPYSRLSQPSGHSIQEDSRNPRERSGDWNTYTSRGPGPSPRDPRDHLSDLPPDFGRRHSGEMDESQYYTDGEGRERIRLVRSGTVAPIPE
ncbi:hypothetical protein EG328_004028 [Venturia inaequalis]|uniref:Uncharacterized protein n=1 Tax=Venturia inaequalis TaxID=5025 RepID=A0A8H3YZ12_VENIN|nr:hypothetical protein EG328_004028 [Venturia inaequalis]